MAHTNVSQTTESEAASADKFSSTADGETSTAMPHAVEAAATVSSARVGTGPILNPQGADETNSSSQ
ncbi:MAG TPA: hypothetical protein VIJ79_02560 [Acidobacteriaceae bacterium]